MSQLNDSLKLQNDVFDVPKWWKRETEETTTPAAAISAIASIRPRAVAGSSPGWIGAGRLTGACIPFSVPVHREVASPQFVIHQDTATWENSLSRLVCRCHSLCAGREGCIRHN